MCIWEKLSTLEYGTYKHIIVVHIDIYESDGISFNMLVHNLFIPLLNVQRNVETLPQSSKKKIQRN